MLGQSTDLDLLQRNLSAIPRLRPSRCRDTHGRSLNRRAGIAQGDHASDVRNLDAHQRIFQIPRILGDRTCRIRWCYRSQCHFSRRRSDYHYWKAG